MMRGIQCLNDSEPAWTEASRALGRSQLSLKLSLLSTRFNLFSITLWLSSSSSASVPSSSLCIVLDVQQECSRVCAQFLHRPSAWRSHRTKGSLELFWGRTQCSRWIYVSDVFSHTPRSYLPSSQGHNTVGLTRAIFQFLLKRKQTKDLPVQDVLTPAVLQKAVWCSGLQKPLHLCLTSHHCHNTAPHKHFSYWL